MSKTSMFITKFIEALSEQESFVNIKVVGELARQKMQGVELSNSTVLRYASAAKLALRDMGFLNTQQDGRAELFMFKNPEENPEIDISSLTLSGSIDFVLFRDTANVSSEELRAELAETVGKKLRNYFGKSKRKRPSNLSGQPIQEGSEVIAQMCDAGTSCRIGKSGNDIIVQGEDISIICIKNPAPTTVVRIITKSGLSLSTGPV